MEVTYLMTDSFPSYFGLVVICYAPIPSHPQEEILFCWVYVYSFKYEALQNALETRASLNYLELQKPSASQESHFSRQ